MLIPTKHERLEISLIALGADIIQLLKKQKFNIEELYQKLKDSKSISLEKYYDTVTFLWLAEIVNINYYFIELRKK